MNIETIRANQTAVLNAKRDLYGEQTQLTPEQQTEITDALAAELDDLNPNHQYPPVNK